MFVLAPPLVAITLRSHFLGLYKKVVIAKNKTVKLAVLMTSLCHFIASYDTSLLKN